MRKSKSDLRGFSLICMQRSSGIMLIADANSWVQKTQAAVREASSPISTEPLDIAFHSVIRFLDRNRPSIYNSTDIYKEYMDAGGTSLSRRQLVQKVVDYFTGDWTILSSLGIAAILAFKLNAANVLHMLPDETDVSDTDVAVDKVATKISREIRDNQIERRELSHPHQQGYLFQVPKWYP